MILYNLGLTSYKLVYDPHLTLVIHTINHSEIGVRLAPTERDFANGAPRVVSYHETFFAGESFGGHPCIPRSFYDGFCTFFCVFQSAEDGKDC